MKSVAWSVLLVASLGRSPAAQESASDGLVVERTVKRTSIDWLGRKEEIQRKERLLIRGGNLAILDLTFGERLIIRTDLKRIWKADPLARTYAEFSFDEAAARRKAALDEIRAAKARVPGTTDEKDLEDMLQGFDQFASPPQLELKATGAQRELILNADRVRLSVQINDKIQAPGWMGALAATGAFHPSVAEKLRALGGLPVKGTIRYALFLDRIVEQFEVTSTQSREIADAEFELPPGLTRAPLRGFEPPPPRAFSVPPVLKASFKEDDGDRPKPDGGEKKDK
ncbi:MAG TPA: hypothetical protein VKW04_06840 [Planctomycetota bacterium]|nr:hypothetical protein [Planctomycetota bacterium]